MKRSSGHRTALWSHVSLLVYRPGSECSQVRTPNSLVCGCVLFVAQTPSNHNGQVTVIEKNQERSGAVFCD